VYKILCAIIILIKKIIIIITEWFFVSFLPSGWTDLFVCNGTRVRCAIKIITWKRLLPRQLRRRRRRRYNIIYCDKRNLESSRRCTGTRPRKSRYRADTYTVIRYILFICAVYLITLYIKYVPGGGHRRTDEPRPSCFAVTITQLWASPSHRMYSR